MEMSKLMLKYIRKHRALRIAKTMLSKSKVGGLTPLGVLYSNPDITVLAQN
jgi:hypothetical protein